MLKSGMPLQFVATYDSSWRGQRMAEKTIVEKAAEKVGYGLAMAEDAATSVKTAVGAAVATVTKSLKKTPPPKAAKKAAVHRPAKKAAQKKAVKKTAAKTAPTKKAASKK